MAHGFLQAPLHLRVVAVDLHVDEVDDDQTRQILQAQLTGNLIGRFQVGSQRRFLDIAFPGRFAGVHVDGNQGFRRVDDDIAARFQLNLGIVNAVDLVFDPMGVEQRDRVVPVGLHLFAWLGIRASESFAVRYQVALDNDVDRVPGIHVPDGTPDRFASS